LPDEPVDPVWLTKGYKTKIYSVEEAIQFHIELANEMRFNNMDGFLYARFLLDMTAKKKGKIMENIQSTINFPHFFADGFKKEVIAICAVNTR
jgi:large subunit ribosomal protein L1